MKWMEARELQISLPPCPHCEGKAELTTPEIDGLTSDLFLYAFRCTGCRLQTRYWQEPTLEHWLELEKKP